MEKLLKFSKDTILYALGVFLQKGIAFLLIPIYARKLNTEGYGVYETLLVVSQTLLIFFDLGISRAILRFCTSEKEPTEIKQILRTSLILVCGLSVLLSLVIFPFADDLSSVLLKDDHYSSYILLVIVWMIGSALNQVILSYFRAQQNARRFIRYSIFISAGIALLNVLFLLVFNFGIPGIIVGNLLPVWAVSLAWMIKLFLEDKSLSFLWLKRILGFGAPLILSMIGLFIINSADRYILAIYTNMNEVGIYGLGYKIGLLVNIAILTPFQLAWPNFVFERENHPKNKELFSKILLYLLTVICVCSIILLFFSKELILLLGSDAFLTAAEVVPYILLAYIFYSVYYFFSAFFLLRGKTMTLSVITLSIACLNLILNFLLIRSLGWRGAAISTVVSVLGLGLLTAIFGQHYIDAGISYKKSGYLFLCTALVIGAYYALSSLWSSGIDYWIRPVLILAYLLSLVPIFRSDILAMKQFQMESGH